MSTINQELAEQIAAKRGYYEDDPRCYAVFEYYNHNFDKYCYAIAYSQSDFDHYRIYKIVRILWSMPLEELEHGIKAVEVNQ